MQFLSNFRQTSKIEVLKRVNKEPVRCSVDFNEEIIAVFKFKNLKLSLK